MRPLFLRSHHGTVASDRCFCGSNADSMALAALAEGPTALLGLGVGGVLAALGAFGPKNPVAAVDIDPVVSEATRAVFAAWFPHVDFESVHRDAFRYVEEYCGEPFSAFCVDIFGDDSYPPGFFDEGLWDGIRRATTRDSLVVVNTWGLPHHLSPLAGPTPHSRVAGLLASRWPHVAVVSDLRNQTVIASDRAPSAIGTRDAVGARTAVDAVIARVEQVRWRDAAPVRATPVGAADGRPPTAEAAVPQSMAALDAEFQRRMPEFLRELSSFGAPRQHEGEANRVYLGRLLSDADTTTALLGRMLAGGSERASFVPSYIKGYRSAGAHEFDWWPTWLAANLGELVRDHRAWALQHAVPLTLGMIADPFQAPVPGADAFVREVGGSGDSSGIDGIFDVAEIDELFN